MKNVALSMKSLFAIFFIFITAASSSFAQGSAGSSASLESRSIIDMPTAGILPAGSLAMDMDFFQSGGLLLGVHVGVINRFTIGVSFGGTGIIGDESVRWNDLPGINARFRPIEESTVFPAIVIGIETQGKGAFDDRLDRYSVKSPGLFLVGSKNYAAFGYLGFHGGINYSFERKDGDRDPNFFLGVEKTLGPAFTILGEYNLGFNDSSGDALGRGRGYLNLGLRVSIGNGLTFGMSFRDILKNQENRSAIGRTITLEYVTSL